MAVVVSAVVGYALLLALTLAIKDIPSVLNARDASGNKVPAVIAIFSSALGARAGSLFTALAAMAMWFCGLSAVTWISRTLYAFARDKGLPGSAVWRRVSATHQTPAPAIWLCVVIAFLATISSRHLCRRDVDQRHRPVFFLHHSRVSCVARARPAARRCRADRGTWADSGPPSTSSRCSG